MNFIHEMYIHKMIGSETYLKFYTEYTKGKQMDFLDRRIEKINNEI